MTLVLLRELGLGEQSTLVDLGAGTGTLAFTAGTHCRRVVPVDASAEMVVAMKRKAERLGVANVECVQAGFLSYEHQGTPAEFVYSRNALHHLPDFWKAIALERISVILRPGGILRLRDLVFVFDPREAERVIADWLDSGAETSRKRLHAGRLRGASARRVQHVQLAARADARTSGVRDHTC